MMKNITLPTYILNFTCAVSLTLLSGCDASKGTQNPGSTNQAPDSVVVDFPIAYIDRPIPRDEDGMIIADNYLEPALFRPGARLIIKDRALVPAPETIITDDAFSDPNNPDALYDVKDLSVSADGSKLLFAMRAPEDDDLDEDEQAKWNIWEYDIESAALRRIIDSNLFAEAGQDLDPAYLPDGRIVFSSTRQTRSKAILLDENKPQFSPLTEGDNDQEAFTLHIMDADGTNIQQITYNQSHDIAPTVLNSGKIVFSRWNNYVGGGVDKVSLYSVNPDGTEVSPYYGHYSQNTGTNGNEAVLIDALVLENGTLLAGLRERESINQGGDIVFVDGENFTDFDQVNPNGSGGISGQTSASSGIITTDSSISPQGYYSSIYPLFDGTERTIVSWSACLVQGIALGVYLNTNGELINDEGVFVDEEGDPLRSDLSPQLADADDVSAYPCSSNVLDLIDVAAAIPRYGIWTFDPILNTQTPVVLATEERMYTEALAIEPRTGPSHIPPTNKTEAERELAEQNLGIVHIRSVYDFHGTDNTSTGIDAVADPMQTMADQRPARFLRILKAVSIPSDEVYDFDRSAFGRSGGQMKDILGYVPIEPDGSAKFTVPADVAFTFSVLDKNGRRIATNISSYLGDRHANWLTVRPGETRECGGCHERGNRTAHGRLDAEATSSWGGAVGGAHFANTVLLDEFSTPHSAPDSGETMAEYYARVKGPRMPKVNIEYIDEWTDTSILTANASFDYSYADLPSATPPVSAACQSKWTPLCRVVIHYIEHVHPIWEVDRSTVDAAGMIIEDNTCTSCHDRVNADGQAQLPSAQLELTGGQSDVRNDYLTAYAELFFPDVPQEIVEGVLVDQMEQDVDADGNLLFRLDVDGNQVLDGDGNPIPILVTVAPRNAYLSAAGARNNTRFFNLFVAGGSHQGFLNEAELKLLSEWLDIGGQYYNNPFDAPLN